MAEGALESRHRPNRPHKPAKGINIYFTREFRRAYGGLDATRQSDWDAGRSLVRDAGGGKAVKAVNVGNIVNA